MSSGLKSFKTLQVLPNGCVYFDHSIYLKTYKKYNFLKKNLTISPFNKTSSNFHPSNFFYTKYRNQIFKNLTNEFTVNCKKY
jgi:hypothetical protein